MDFYDHRRDGPHVPYWQRMTDMHNRTRTKLRSLYEAGANSAFPLMYTDGDFATPAHLR